MVGEPQYEDGINADPNPVLILVAEGNELLDIVARNR